ncbi:MAG: PhzF family phenazine biosynthesis protein [Altererythrobacter sp.]|nr:PhzF family phenazine biosynthesis protein [Altererythrobacter sp.]
MKIDLVDVFGSGALSGNPLAVVHGGDDLSADQMLALTQWLGFSETTFLLPPSDQAADYRVRIFYPGGELPFAGHPTLGSCYAWMAAGGLPQQDSAAIQECGVGLVEVRRDGTQLAFKAPPFTRQGPLTEDERKNAIKLTGVNPDAVVEAVHVQNGPQWQLLRLSNAADVLAADPASKVPLGTDIGLAGPCEQGADADWELRAFFANATGRFVEDPVTGSFNAGVAMHLFGSGLTQGRSYRAAQGRKTGADGLVECWQETDGSVWIGGRCAMVSQGGALLPIA